MKLEHYSQEKLKAEILEIAKKYIDLSEYKVFIFGSRVSGKAGERSDIDVGIEGAKEVSSGKFLSIQEEISNIPTLYKIDVVDFARVSEEFKKVAKESIEMLN